MRSSAASSNVGSASTSSDGVDDLDFLAELLGDDADGVVGQRLRERRHLAHAHELLDDLGDGHAEVLGDVLDGRAGVDLDDVGARLRALVSGVIVSSYVPRRRRPRPRGGRRGGPWGPPPGPPGPPGPRREAWESMTTRRRPPAPALPGARSPRRSPRLGRPAAAPPPAPPAAPPWRWPRAAVRPCPSRRPGVRRPPSAGRAGPARRAARRGCRCAGRRPGTGCAEGRAAPVRFGGASSALPFFASGASMGWPAMARLACVLVDRGGLGLHLDAGSAEALDDLLGGHVVLARQLVDSLLCHSPSDTSGESSSRTTGRRYARWNARRRMASSRHWVEQT